MARSSGGEGATAGRQGRALGRWGSLLGRRIRDLAVQIEWEVAVGGVDLKMRAEGDWLGGEHEEETGGVAAALGGSLEIRDSSADCTAIYRKWVWVGLSRPSNHNRTILDN